MLGLYCTGQGDDEGVTAIWNLGKVGNSGAGNLAIGEERGAGESLAKKEADDSQHGHAAVGDLGLPLLLQSLLDSLGGKKPIGASAPGMLSTVKKAFLTAWGREIFLTAKASREVEALFVVAGGAKAMTESARMEARARFIIVFFLLCDEDVSREDCCGLECLL